MLFYMIYQMNKNSFGLLEFMHLCNRGIYLVLHYLLFEDYYFSHNQRHENMLMQMKFHL